MGFFGSISFPRWYGEALFTVETADIATGPNSVVNTVIITQGVAVPVEVQYGAGLISYGEQSYGYSLGRLADDTAYLFILGAALRVIAFLCLRYTNRLKQR